MLASLLLHLVTAWLDFSSLIVNLHGDGICNHVSSFCSFFLEIAQALKLVLTYLTLFNIFIFLGPVIRIVLGRSPYRSSQSPNPSSLPEAIMSKLATASARYKLSISKRKKSLEKLLVRNKSMKELRKGVKREVNAGIAGVTLMIERLDHAIKRLRGSPHVSTTSTSTASRSKSKQ